MALRNSCFLFVRAQKSLGRTVSRTWAALGPSRVPSRFAVTPGGPKAVRSAAHINRRTRVTV